ncbi:MAG TPA: SRPBCC family protein [Thermoanaerobaculia bacterium]|nr:SRPBCC family protein [Thermoanaerobaculia bacterium]
MTANPTSAAEDRLIIGSRTFDAPRELVFHAWSDAAHLARWWGPKGFTLTTSQFEFRPGGVWEFVMHGPDGRDYSNRIVYSAIDPPSRIAYSHTTGPLFDAEATFEERDGRTTVTMRMTFPTAELRHHVVEEFGAIEGLHQTLGRLADLLAETPVFELTRELDAPRDLVWAAWTDEQHLTNWWGPVGLKMQSLTNDFRPDGMMHFGMSSANGPMMWGRWIYREIVPPERLVFVSSFSDEQGGITRAPFAGDWPLEMLGIVTLTETAGRTTVRLRSLPLNASESERNTFHAGFASMRGGWGASLDQLAAYLGQV